MESKTTKKLIFYSILVLIIGIFVYWILNVRMNPTLASKQNFSSTSSGIMWDTTNIWTAYMKPGQINKLDGSGTFITSFSTGGNPIQLLPIGVNVWASNYDQMSVSKVNINDGTMVQISVGLGPIGMAFDGVNVWVCNVGGNSCSVINQGSAVVTKTINVGVNPMSVLFDGSNIWVACSGSSEVWLLDPFNLSFVDKFGFGSNSKPVRQTYMKGALYVLLNTTVPSSSSSTIAKVGTNGIIARYSPSIGVCYDIVTDGEYLYVLSAGGGVYVFDTDTNQIKTGFNTGIDAKFIQSVNGTIMVYDQEGNQTGKFSNIGKPLT